MPDFLDIFGEDFEEILEKLDELTPEQEILLLAIIEKATVQADIFELEVQQQINTMKTVVEAIQGVDVSVEDQTASVINAISDNTMFNIGGKKVSFKEIMKTYRRDNKNIAEKDLKKRVIKDLLDSNNFSPITS